MPANTSRGVDRRQFIALGLGAFVVASLPLAARGRQRTVRRTLPVMGSIAEIAVVSPDVGRANAAIDAAMAELARVEAVMTRFTRDSDIGRANLAAARGPVTVRAETARVLTEALRWANATGGAYDPAIGGAVALWDVTRRHEPPPDERVAGFAARHLHHAVEVDEYRGAPAVRFSNTDVQLDLGSIAKGFGVDRAVDALRGARITNALVNVGGDLYALGSAPDGEPWRIGIQDPDDDRRLIGELGVADAAVATSGTYLQFFRYRGHRYHHLIDPTTGAPRETAVQSLTIKADSCMHADVAATALYGLPRERASALLSGVPGAEIVRIA